MKISQEVRRVVAERDGILRPDGYELHHCFFHSELSGEVPKEELEQMWNYQSASHYRHSCIHHASNDLMVGIGQKYELWCKEEALARYQGKYRQALENILNRKRISYGI